MQSQSPCITAQVVPHFTQNRPFVYDVYSALMLLMTEVACSGHRGGARQMRDQDCVAEKTNTLVNRDRQPVLCEARGGRRPCSCRPFEARHLSRAIDPEPEMLFGMVCETWLESRMRSESIGSCDSSVCRCQGHLIYHRGRVITEGQLALYTRNQDSHLHRLCSKSPFCYNAQGYKVILPSTKLHSSLGASPAIGKMRPRAVIERGRAFGHLRATTLPILSPRLHSMRS